MRSPTARNMLHSSAWRCCRRFRTRSSGNWRARGAGRASLRSKRSSAKATPGRASSSSRMGRSGSPGRVACSTPSTSGSASARWPISGAASCRGMRPWSPGPTPFVFPPRRSPGLADENHMLVLDTDGKILAGEGTPNSEFWIHARTYAARPDVGGVGHAHPPACLSLTPIGQPHRVVHNSGGPFLEGVPEYERIGLIRSRELGDALAGCLGGGLAVMMGGHGFTPGAAGRIRAYTREESELVRGQMNASVVTRAWEYYSIAAEQRPLGR